MSIKDIYDIDKPSIKDKKWLIFPKSTFSQLDTMDCNDTIEGKCYEDKTFDQCVQLCGDSPECNYGYFISNKSYGKNICVPLRHSNTASNPVYRLRIQDIYPEMNGMQSKVFIDKKKYPFPPEQANTVFFQDNFLIQNYETKKFLETSPISDKESDQPVGFKKDGNLIVQALEIPPDLSAGTQYVSIKYGDSIAFHIPNTTLVMRPNPLNNTMEWMSRSFTLTGQSTYFLKPLTPGRKMGDEVRYSDIFSIHTSVYIIGIDENSIIEQLYYDSYSEAKYKGANVTFRFIPKMKGWYCNNDSLCTEIPLEEMDINDKGIGIYDGLAICRNPGCFGVCNYKIKDQPRLKQLHEYKESSGKNRFNSYIIILIILILVVLVIWICRKK